ncbi:MAG: dihydropteroate synthase [Candidatus Omnitrophica bacterium]|nr:dihydropteroate synthase [Candidatus Omnitrophota bacterium]
MGIVNVTPDSFSGDGLLKNKKFSDTALRLAVQHIRDGADIIDIGGESSRPGAQRTSATEEIQRIVPVIKKLTKVAKTPISVDTYKGLTACHALDAGASIINNIQGLNAPKSLLKMVANYKAGIIIMHMRGTAATMQKNTNYKNLLAEIITPLRTAIENCLDIGIKSSNIIIDPGIGFAKTAEQNLTILNHLQRFQVLKHPLLIGTSRKSFIGKILHDDTCDRLAGTISSCILAVLHGAHILRVHDVRALKQAVRVVDAIKSEQIPLAN